MTCAHCGKPIESDDGLWYHVETAEMSCDPEGEQSRDRMAAPGTVTLTRTQLAALTELHRAGVLVYPRRAHGTRHATLNALLWAGLARMSGYRGDLYPSCPMWIDDAGAWVVILPDGLDDPAAVARAIARSDGGRHRMSLDTSRPDLDILGGSTWIEV